MVKFRLNIGMLLLVAILVSVWAFPAVATDRTFGLAVSQVVDDVSWGAHTDIPFSLGTAAGEFDAVVQGGEQVKGKYHLGIAYPVGSFAVRVFTDGKVRGESLTSLGRESNVGGGVVFPVIGRASVSVNVFGRNSDPFATPSAHDILVNNGVDADAIAGLGLEDISPATTGLSIKADNTLNASLDVAFAISGRTNLKVRLIPEVFGTEERVDQALFVLETGYQLSNRVSLSGEVDVAVQRYAGEIEGESSVLLTLDTTF